MRREEIHGIVFGLVAGSFLLLLLCGCRTEIKGGQTQHDTHGASITYTTAAGGKFEATDSGERVQTTQPSIKAAGNVIPKVESATEGQIGGISFTQVKTKFANAWPLALLFMGVAAGFWFLAGQRLYAIVCVACAVLALLWPAVLVFVAIGICGLFLWSIRSTLKELVNGTTAAMATQPPFEAAKSKLVMASKHSATTQRVVAGMKV